MPALRLEHYNIRTTRLEPTVRFYAEVIGLRAGPLPSGRPGAWMYDPQDVPIVHINAIDPNDPAAMMGLNAHLGEKDPATLNGSGAIDHVAFEGDDYDGFRSHLARCGVAYKERDVPAMSLRQLFVTDPNGITVEINFHPRRPA